MQYVAFYNLKGYLSQRGITIEKTKNNFIKNSSLVTSGLNSLKGNTLECDELYLKLITRVYFHIKKFVLSPNRVFISI